MPLPILLRTIAPIASKILPDKVERALYGGAAKAVVGGGVAGVAGGIAGETLGDLFDEDGLSINSGGTTMPGTNRFTVWVDENGKVVKVAPYRKRRRRRLLTASDKADISALNGIMGDGVAFRRAAAALLSRRLG